MGKQASPGAPGWIGAVAVGTLACTPQVDPLEVISRPTELGIRVAVDPGPPSQRSFNETLPGDRARLIPFVADVGGPVPFGELDLHWVRCGTRGCLDPLERLDALPECEDSPYHVPVACSLGRGPTAELALGELDPSALYALSLLPGGLLAGPAIAYLGSRRGGPGPAACSERLAARTSLEGCLLAHRNVTMGPESAIADLAAEHGLDLGLTEDGPFLQQPRNRNPEVERFAVLVGADPVRMVASGSSITVASGDEVTFAYEPDVELDRDDYEWVDASGELHPTEEVLTARWFIDRSFEHFESSALSSTRLTWTVSGPAGRSTLYALVRDENGGEAFGWLHVDVAPD